MALKYLNKRRLGMRQTFAMAAIIVGLAAHSASADERESHVSNAFGTKNPEELSLRGALDRLQHGEWHPMTSAIGYGAAKAGMHEVAREIFTDSARRGNVQGMTWLSWMEDNGLAGPENPKAAAYWAIECLEQGLEDALAVYALPSKGRRLKSQERLIQEVGAENA